MSNPIEDDARAFNQVASLHGVTGVTNDTRVDEPR